MTPRPFTAIFLSVPILVLLSAATGYCRDSLESGITMDAARRVQGTLLFTGSGVSAGATYRFNPDLPDERMAGMNLSWLALGHLSDSGLAAEMRNPGYEALARLSERSTYRADTREISRSRMGFAMFIPSGCLGTVLEKREDLTALVLWTQPLFTTSWSLEIMGSAAEYPGDEADDSWYPEDGGSPGGCSGNLATRLRFFPGGWKFGFTMMGSGGEAIRSGLLGALSWSYSVGPWRYRSRSVLTSPWFRNADMELLDEPAGTSFDIRYRPSSGFQFTLDYQAASERIFPETLVITDEGSFAAGWEFDTVLLSAKTDWNYLVSAPRDSEPLLRRVKIGGEWRVAMARLGLGAALQTEEGWSTEIEGAFPGRGRLLLEPSLTLHREAGPLLVNIRLKMRLNLARLRLITDFSMNDIPRDWSGDTRSSGDGDLTVRFVFDLGDELETSGRYSDP